MIIRHLIGGSLKAVLKILAYSGLGAAAVLTVLFVVYLQSRPDLEIWHTTDLDAEFTRNSKAKNLSEYLVIEDQVFKQLDTSVYDKVAIGPAHQVNRYSRGSLADPTAMPTNWNRSYELKADKPKGAVMLLHGLSDSPYSLRSLGERLQAAGMHVLALRMPGHGTAPSGLTSIDWRDMAAAVNLGMDHLKQVMGDGPLYVVGYSTGGALAVHYALSGLRDPSQARLDGIVLISPAIGVSSLAVLAVWQARLGHFLGLDKLEWNSLLPEYDPYKYGSFAVNAGDQVYRLTVAMSELMDARSKDGTLSSLPPILAFQSGVDATVSAPALVSGLMQKLPAGKGELVLFDINRLPGTVPLLRYDPKVTFDSLTDSTPLPFSLSILTNRSSGDRHVQLLRKKAGDSDVSESGTDMVWPNDIYSLAHVALPFKPDDPIYGASTDDRQSGTQLGNLALRGERGVLQITGTDMLRQRWNPFYDYMEARILDFLGIQTARND